MGQKFGKIKSEQVTYKIIKKTDSYEIRLYDERFAIETSYQYNNKKRGSSFIKLASYIGVKSKPQNKSNQFIPMTSPVVTTKSLNIKRNNTNNNNDNNNSYHNSIQFYLPKKYKNINDIPIPNNNEIFVVERKEKLYAIKTFNGDFNYNHTIKIKNNFINELKNDNIKYNKPIHWELYRYNSIYTLPQFKRNEIAIEINSI